MNLKLYFLIAVLGLSLGACSSSQTRSSAAPQATNTTNTAVTTNEGPQGTFVQGCKTELETYCKNVTPGDGRIIACIYAHEDKLSRLCENALYDSAQQLENAVATLAYLATECDADIDKHCANVQPGEGRIMDCMEPHLSNVSKRCKKAMQEVGLEK